MSLLDVFLLDNSNNTKQEINIIKPKTYQELLRLIRVNFSNLSEFYEIFVLNENNNEIKINNDINYNKINDILFIREINNNNLGLSIFNLNYNRLSESNQEILDEKYNCILCSIIIKNEKPYFCYKCQKIFHDKCLKDWDKKCKSQNKSFSCPNCRNELPIEKWNKKLDYEENRKDDANLMNQINEYKLNNKMNENINIIKDRKINELIEKNNQLNELIKKYENYINKTLLVFNNILNKIELMHSLFTLENNFQLNELLNIKQFNSDNFDNNLNKISNVINEELEKFIEIMINNNKTEINSVNNKINLLNVNKMNLNISNNYEEEINSKNSYQKIDNNVDIFNNPTNKENTNYKCSINIGYFTKNSGIYNIFGENFVMNNFDKIDLIINGEQHRLVNSYKLKMGENIVTVKIKNDLTNLSFMFYLCVCLKNIDELNLLDVKNVNDFSHIFQGCSILSDIKSLQNWDVSNGINFSSMFEGCTSLSDIKALENWNFSQCNNLSHMFHGCALVKDIEPLKNWNVSNCNSFSNMFKNCSKLSNIKPLEKWNVSKCNNFSFMFYGCSISDVMSLENWEVHNDKNFNLMFRRCSFFMDLTPLQKWSLSKEKMDSIK